MQKMELEITGGTLCYEMTGETARVVEYGGLGLKVEIPACIEGNSVTEIGKKAFLSRKNLREIVIPDGVEEIGDWAFAHCDGLVWVSLPGRKIRFGKAVFKDCGRLEAIRVRNLEEKGMQACGKGHGRRETKSGVPKLLAAAVRWMDAYYLLDPQEAGGKEWTEKWDARLLSILLAPDQEGYSKQVLCGEEDYGSTDLDAFKSSRRKVKVRLAFLRLLYPIGLSKAFETELENYLRGHTKGKSGEEAWLVLKEEHGNDREYYELFAELGCVDEANCDGILSDIGEAYPEMKAYFMRIMEGKSCAEDFFADLEL